MGKQRRSYDIGLRREALRVSSQKGIAILEVADEPGASAQKPE